MKTSNGMKSKKRQLVLGIDPGVACVGWGIVKGKKDQLTVGPYGCIRTNKNLLPEKRLSQIYHETKKIIQKNHPDLVAVEQLFFYKNVKTAISVSQARGVILLAVDQSNTPLREFTPLQTKQAISGYGRADKLQIQKMIKILLKLKKLPKPDDTADALAAAICCLVTKNHS